MFGTSRPYLSLFQAESAHQRIPALDDPVNSTLGKSLQMIANAVVDFAAKAGVIAMVDSELTRKLSSPDLLPTDAEARKFIEQAGKIAASRFFRTPTFQQYEIFTQEYVQGLAAELLLRAERYGASPEKPLVVLETGAGDGRLTHFLKMELLQTDRKGLVKLECTDNGSWDINPRYPAECLSNDRSLEKHKPDVVICSWMDPNVDLSSSFRTTPSVKEYFLIGNEGACGTQKSWNGGFGWEHVQHQDLEKHQVCRYDYATPEGSFVRHSLTESWVRK